MALPDTKTLDIGFLKVGPFVDYAGNSAVDTKTLDYAFLKSGPFVAYPYSSAPPVVTGASQYILILGVG